jgi:hypothetical protein
MRRRDRASASRIVPADLISCRPMTCPQCGQRRARRGCPALAQTICTVCCATKRLVEIRCPATCPHLANAKAHPSATERRQQEADVQGLMSGMTRLSEPQLQLFFLVNTFFLRPTPAGEPRLLDAEVADAAQAVGATFETASRGVIYEHAARTPAGQRVATELMGWLRDVGKGGGSRFERDVAEVLGSIHRIATPAPGASAGPRDYLDRVGRVLGDSPTPTGSASTLVLP